MPVEVVRRLGLKLGANQGDPFVVIISHDCDLVTDPQDEPFVELALGQPIKAFQSGYTHAQSTYKLHIEYSAQGAAYPVEFCALNKARVNKTELASVEPDRSFELSADGVHVLQTWLAARYKRASFPDALMDRLKPMRDKFANIGKKAPEAIHGLWLSFEPKDNCLPENIPYELWVSVVYSTRVSGALAIAKEAAGKLKLDFERKFKINGTWTSIDLRGCQAFSETEFTYLDLMQTSQWRLEYISMRQSPPGETI